MQLCKFVNIYTKEKIVIDNSVVESSLSAIWSIQMINYTVSSVPIDMVDK